MNVPKNAESVQKNVWECASANKGAGMSCIN